MGYEALTESGLRPNYVLVNRGNIHGLGRPPTLESALRGAWLPGKWNFSQPT